MGWYSGHHRPTSSRDDACRTAIRHRRRRCGSRSASPRRAGGARRGAGRARAADWPARAATPPFRRKRRSDRDLRRQRRHARRCRCRSCCRKRRRPKPRRSSPRTACRPAARRRRPMSALVKTGNELVLIDAGSGAEFPADRRQARRTTWKPPASTRTRSPRSCSPTAMPIICGARSTISTMASAFPNASYVIAAAEWDFWTDPDTPARVPDWLQGHGARQRAHPQTTRRQDRAPQRPATRSRPA